MNGNPKKKKKKKTNTSVDDDVSNPNAAAAAHAVFDDEDIVCDILSRLPANSVLQVKCVCKRWRSLIRDPHFIDLHFRRSKTRPRLFIVNLSRHRKRIGIRYEGFQRRVCFFTTDLAFEHTADERKTMKNSAIHALTKEALFCYDEMLSVNGLICFVNNSNRAACLYNISTREITPWIQSVLRGELEGWDHDADLDTGVGFGFDPVTKDYKVICQSRFSRKVKDGSYKHHEVWEVLKLGDNAWRRIEEVPTLRLGSSPLCVHVNGTVYWFPSRDVYNFGLYLLAFDVGTEKFRTIPIPKFISEQILNIPDEVFREWIHFLQVDGCVAVLRRMSVNNVKLFIFDDNFKDSSEDGNFDTGNWIEDTMTLPMECSVHGDPRLDAVVGTDQIILEIHGPNSDGKWKESRDIHVYSCDWKDKTFKEMEIRGFPSSLPVDRYPASLGIPFTENLLPLQTLDQP